MTRPGPPSISAEAAVFDSLMAQVMSVADQFGHREHVHLTWLAVRRYGMTEAIDLISNGIQRTARYAGAPQKYHATVSRAWVELIGHHAAENRAQDFADFAEQNPTLLDKRLLTRFYNSTTLAGTQARQGWIPPDRAPFPGRIPTDQDPDTADDDATRATNGTDYG